MLISIVSETWCWGQIVTLVLFKAQTVQNVITDQRDMKKAFDSVHHGILLNKLKKLGLSNSCLRWFRSYFSNRSQVTRVNGIISDKSSIGYGVPQGSILGPLLFVIFINDLLESLMNYRSHLYADDTAITVTGITTNEIELQLNDRLQETKQWMNDNVLTLNLKKTNAMVFGTKHTISQLNDLEISCEGVNIEVVSKTKYLGVILDSELKFTEHVNYLKQKLIGRTKMLGKLHPLIGQELTLELYKSLVLPVIDYADVVYDCLSSKSSRDLQKLQNYALRIVLQADYDSHI